MQIKAGCLLNVEASAPVPAIFMLRPRSGASQWIWQEEYLLQPAVSVTEYTDSYGNLCQRFVIPQGTFQLESSVCAETSDVIDVQADAPFVPIQDLPDGVIQFLLPSRYCPCDQIEIGELASQITTGIEPGYAQVGPFVVGFSITLDISTV